MKAVLCPVCNGNGQVSSGFYSHPGDYPYWVTSGTEIEGCRSCKGKGWVEVNEDTFEYREPTIPLDPQLQKFYAKKGYDVCSACGGDRNSPSLTCCPLGSHYGIIV